MNFVADESVDHPIVIELRQLGHHVLAIAEEAPRSDDTEVLQRARALDAILLTNDKDFGELVYRQRLHSAGILLLRLSGLSREAKIEAVVSAIREHGRQVKGMFAVLSPGQLRIREP